MTPLHRALVVDDEPIVREVVCEYLRRDGFETLEAADGRAALAALDAPRLAIVLLDIMIPRPDGLEVCRHVRARSDLPVILLTARGEEADRIVGLELGADDYVTKPFSPRELVARVRTVLRRSEGSNRSRRAVVGPLVIDSRTREVTRDGVPLRLTAKEFDLLAFLATHPRQVFSRDHLMDSVWGYQATYDTGTVTVHVRRLREKIELDPASPALLQTVWGVGYRLVPPAEPAA